jgi:hypothetical protein
MSVHKNSKKNIYVYTRNHNSKFSIISLLRILRKKLPTYNLITTNKFNYNSPHILIEGFDKDFILKAKSEIIKKKIKIIILCTEFISVKNNSFETNNISRKNNFYKMLKFYQKFQLNKINFIRICSTIIFKTLFKKNNNYNNAKNMMRHEERYKYFKKLLIYNPLIINTHPKISSQLLKILNLESDTIFFKLKKLKVNKNKINILKFSGSVTEYRKSFLKKISLKIDNNSKFIEASSLKSMYSIHPKKNERWKSSSPARYIDALCNGEIPITVGKFEDDVYKDLTININKLEKLNTLWLTRNYKHNIKIINIKIEKYNKKIFSENNRFKKKLKLFLNR